MLLSSLIGPPLLNMLSSCKSQTWRTDILKKTLNSQNHVLSKSIHQENNESKNNKHEENINANELVTKTCKKEGKERWEDIHPDLGGN